MVILVYMNKQLILKIAMATELMWTMKAKTNLDKFYICLSIPANITKSQSLFGVLLVGIRA